MSSRPPKLVPLGRLSRPDQAADRGDQQARAPNGARVYMETYGCQMNVADSGLMVGILGATGARPVERAEDADVILINTCAVREKAEERVYARAQELAAQKKHRRGVVLCIVGCMAEHLKAGLAERAPYVDVIAGPDSYRRLPALIDEARHSARRRKRAPLIDVQLDKHETYSGLTGISGGDGVSGFVSIQRGCDKFCSFCVVPFTRGRERGTPPDEVLEEVRAYAAAGYREVVLLGQTVNSYRHAEVGFADLLRRVAAVDGIERIRFTSPYPTDFSSEVIETIAREPKVCNHVHLPLQSGSDRVLERMRRNHTAAEYLAIVEKLRAAIPDIAITTDILSGFCGETEEDHRATLELMQKVRFDSSFMFVYSERELTQAAKKLRDDVPEPVKKRRIKEIVELQEEMSAAIYAEQVGKQERILIHARSKRSKEQLVGRTGGFKAVVVPGSSGRPGDLIDVRIERSTMATLFGRP